MNDLQAIGFMKGLKRGGLVKLADGPIWEYLGFLNKEEATLYKFKNSSRDVTVTVKGGELTTTGEFTSDTFDIHNMQEHNNELF